MAEELTNGDSGENRIRVENVPLEAVSEVSWSKCRNTHCIYAPKSAEMGVQERSS